MLAPNLENSILFIVCFSTLKAIIRLQSIISKKYQITLYHCKEFINIIVMNKILTERGTKKCKVILTHSEDIFMVKIRRQDLDAGWIGKQ